MAITSPNRFTERVAYYAMEAGLQPYTTLRGGATYRAKLSLILNGPGVDSPFGVVFIGARSGRVLRGVITFGNEGPTRRYQGALEVLAALQTIARTAAI